MTLLVFAKSVFAVEVTILYWGDRFARDLPTPKSASDTTKVGGAAQLAAFVKTYRANNPDAFLFVAGGDLAGTLAARETKGVAPAKVLAKMKPDVYSPGVVDFSHGSRKLKEALTKSKLNAILGNVHQNEIGTFLPTFDDIRTANVKVAVTALLPPRLKELVPREGVLDLTIADPIATTKDFIKDRRENSDLIVILSQLGRNYDSLLAATVPGIDLIIEGHSRTTFDPLLQVGKTLIVSTGAKGLYLGKLRLEVESGTQLVTLIDHELISVESGVIRTDIDVKRAVKELEERYSRMKGDKVGTLLTNWNVDQFGPSNLPQWVADQMQQSTGSSKLALVNNLDFEAGIDRGDIHENQLYGVMPFDIPLIAFQIKGYEIRRVVERQVAGQLPFLTWSGVRVIVEQGISPEIIIEHDGALIDENEYAVVTNGLLWDRFLDETSLVPEVRPMFIFPITQYELMIEGVVKQKVISTPLDGRWMVR